MKQNIERMKMVKAMEFIARQINDKDLMALFLRLMTRANKSGGLYCGGVVSD